MDKVLLVDFGATHIKSSIYDFNLEKHENFRKISAPQNISNKQLEFVVSQRNLVKIFKDICESYSVYGYAAIFISSQMHGFVVVDRQNNPLTDYIGWQDHRGPSLQIEEFENITGMKDRVGLPVYNLHHMIETEKCFDQKIKVVTLPDLLSNISGKSENLTHTTMLASTGFFDIRKNEISQQIVNKFKCDLSFNDSTSLVEVSGYYGDIPIYAGIGDLQSATYGANDPCSVNALVNIGTGSQVSMVSETKNPPVGVEYRPYVGHGHLHTITHIPAGRSLSAYMNLFSSMGINCWERIKKYSYDDFLRSTLEIDLSIFDSARGFVSGGSISGIKENDLNIDNFLASLVKSLALQYVPYIKKISANNDIEKIILSGGIPRSIPAISVLISGWSNKPCMIQNTKIDETLCGLSNISRDYCTKR